MRHCYLCTNLLIINIIDKVSDTFVIHLAIPISEGEHTRLVSNGSTKNTSRLFLFFKIFFGLSPNCFTIIKVVIKIARIKEFPSELRNRNIFFL